ncbi:RHS repeat-associated core domain-containing protein, partial [Streptomyces atratus]|uniref:RHS repeat-associated core domain-containing protein n=1 Tax=Streptomyces atratus TaxID=1893 RepID=UPI0033FD0DC3
RGQKLKETKANDNTVDYTYYLDSALKSTSEKKPNGTLVASHTYAYDPNGNKAQDVAKKMNADDHAAYLSSTTDYTYDPVERLAKSVKTGTGAGTETYVHDDNANVISQTVKGTSTTYNYDRNRLLTATTGGTTANYNYDPFGRQDSVTSGGKVIERSVYDGFDHVVESQKADDTGALRSTKYTFDPLDRTASKTADGKTTDFEYLGLSGEVLDEKVAGELTKSYQYSPWGERLSQIKHNTDGTTEDGFYGYNSHSDVETLTDKNGDSKATYGYTAYGSDDKSEFTGIDKPDTTDPTKDAYNPYRFNAKRWDAQSGTYDMGFRDYNPGLNRFTTRDMYNGALADMNLGNDPMTGNRYAFTGGNPISRVELDGHRPDYCDDPGVGCRMTSTGWEAKSSPIPKSDEAGSSPNTPHDVAPFDSKSSGKDWFNYALTQTMSLYNTITEGACWSGLQLSCDLWNRYREQSGDTYTLQSKTVDNLLEDEGLSRGLKKELERWESYATSQCAGGGTCSFSGDSGWLKTKFQRLDAKNAIGSVKFRVTGSVTMGAGGEARTRYQVDLFKNWNFDRGKTAPVPFLTEATGKEIDLGQFVDLHEHGWAQEYDMVGTSTMHYF